VAGTASNPATIASWAAIFAAANTAGAATTTQAAVLLVVGVAVGSLSWVTPLASGVAVARRGLDDRAARIADAVAGLAMVGTGGTLAYATAHERWP
jgi:putative LysE/RhtB family amino acid efflux pump